jgi:hypothetical protein
MAKPAQQHRPAKQLRPKFKKEIMTIAFALLNIDYSIETRSPSSKVSYPLIQPALNSPLTWLQGWWVTQINRSKGRLQPRALSRNWALTAGSKWGVRDKIQR